MAKMCNGACIFGTRTIMAVCLSVNINITGMANKYLFCWFRVTPLLDWKQGARCGSVVRAFARGAVGRQIDTSWGEPTELFLVPASAPQHILFTVIWRKTYG